MEVKREEVGAPELMAPEAFNLEEPKPNQINDKLYQALRNKEEMKKGEMAGNTYDTYVEPEEIKDDGSDNALTGTFSLL